MKLRGPENYAAYFTRTPKANTSVVIVGSDGNFKEGLVERDDIGVRPMISIDLGKIAYSAGNGTKKNPYIVVIQ